MVTVKTDDFPYTLQYVRELLKVEEHVLIGYAKALSLSLKADDQTGGLVFSQKDIDLLRKAIELTSRGEDISTVVKYLRGNSRKSVDLPTSQSNARHTTRPEEFYPGELPQDNGQNNGAIVESLPLPAGLLSRSSGQPSKNGQGSTKPLAHSTGDSLATTSKENLAMIVDSVSQAKESILKDLSKLLDDKLAGLDEVVVELIRCKSENDLLKQKLQDLAQENQNLHFEISRFKPVQFGFYRKLEK